MRGEVERVVGPEVAATSAQLVLDLADAIACGDISFDAMVKLLGGIKPASTWQGGRVAGSAAAGRMGCATGATAFEDAERALRALWPIIHGVYVRALGGSAPVQSDFGLINLLTAARSVSATSMREVFVDVFRSIATQYRRLRAGGSDPDWEATVSAAHACSLQPVGVRDAAREAAQDMMRGLRIDDAKSRGEGEQNRKPRGEKRKDRREERKEAREAQQTDERGAKRTKGGGKEGDGKEGGGGGGGGGGGPPPLQPADVEARSISRLLTRTGAGAIEVLDRLFEGAGVPRSERPCSWLAVTGKCRNAGAGKCRACAAGGDKKKTPPALLAALRKGCSSELLGELDEKLSPLRL